MLPRRRELEEVARLLQRHPVVGLVGARQVGKTTLARQLVKQWAGATQLFDLEDPTDLARLADPMLALRDLRGLVVLDEIQRAANIFPILRVLADRRPRRARFLLLGSASPDMLRPSSESLAGRIAYRVLHGLSLSEVDVKKHNRLWLRGGFPRAYLAASDAQSQQWRKGFVRTFLERDLPQLGIRVSSTTLRRFWTMLAHYHGQTWNSSEFARSFGVADTTVRGYLDILTSACVVRQLQPWHENISKRQVKSPKVYLADSGLLHTLLGLTTMSDLLAHPKVGASWEGFVIQQLITTLDLDPEECYHWRTHAGAELDLLIVRGRRRYGVEVKRTTAPAITPSMRSALADLKLHRLVVVHDGTASFQLAPKIRAVTLPDLLDECKTW